jgi:oligoribonuclease NrnB/cAMP/cGMP phosphodiesterase (DHH superfamily)
MFIIVIMTMNGMEGMDSFSRDDRDRHLITRGNVDGIVCASLFLRMFPYARVSFVTSPTAGARILSMDRSSSNVVLADLALVPELEKGIREIIPEREVITIDHHQPHATTEAQSTLVVREGMSAASVLYHHLGLDDEMRKLVAIADLMEYCETDLLEEEIETHGLKKVFDEARVLDFSWRLDIGDDLFRAQASARLSRGIWPSEIGMIKRRYLQVVNEQRWPKALARVSSNLLIRGETAVLESHDKNRSLYGFGTRALVEVARKKGCNYAVMVNQRKQHSSVSLRGLRPDGVNLGRFVEDFTAIHGLEGGGHPTSAGARIPVETTDRFLNEFVSLTNR